MTASPYESSSYGFDWPAYSSEFTASAPSSGQTPLSIVPSGAVDFSSGQLGHQDLIYQQVNMQLADSLRNKSLEPLQTTASQKATAAVTGSNDAAQFRVGEGMTFDKSSMGFYPQMGLPYQRKSHDQGQGSIGHARRGSTSSSRNAPASPESTRNAVVIGSISEDAGAAILDPLLAFCSSVVRRQCEMSGVASAVADYVAWIRNIPQSGASPATSSVYKTMLENIEIRVRELIEIAEAGHPPSFREMLVALERSAPPGGSMASRLASLEEELQRQVHDHSHFFQTRYDACRRLAEQGRESPQ
ncbi:hypothetical protein DL771_003405 [Monosporascus sp. 5C6A]|nr:hypothetical protein DL771_003405 [Monosporascus sp. 5C6A]